MAEPMHAGLPSWESFYVIVGSSSAALIGLQFVVITLIAGARMRRTPTTISAFATPTVVHFVGALVIAAVMSTPWGSRSSTGMALLACGLLGTAYSLRVIQRARRQTTYVPVWEDWVWHMILPSVAYASVAIAAVFLRQGSEGALFAVAGCALALLLIGIHNAWDTVTYIVVAAPKEAGADDDVARGAGAGMQERDR